MQHILLFNNATIALITALQALRITGEVITTLYLFVATLHAILWNGLTLVFVDIENDGYNIDYRKIEQAITLKTLAILLVYCYLTLCEVEEI